MIIDGKAIAHQIQIEIKDKVAHLTGRKPCLAVILVGDNPASLIYVQRKAQSCEAVGILSLRQHFKADISEETLLQHLHKLNADPTVDGILIQLPLPSHINPMTIIRNIDPRKDVDGLHPINAGKLLVGDTSGFVPCTPLGVKVLLERSEVNTVGKHVVVLGRSNLVGKPMAALMVQDIAGGNATVSIVHSFSRQGRELCRMADILIVAIGKAKFVTSDMVKEGAVVIDVGINKVQKEDRFQIVGDVDFENVKEKCAMITPVPGGVGPMTIAMLLSNTLQARNNDNKEQ